MLNTRIPPQSVDSEVATLASMLQSQDACDIAFEILKEESFYDLKNQIIFRAMTELNKSKEPIDQITVTVKLQEMKLLEDIGGAFVLSQMINRVPTHHSVGMFANIVKDKKIKRDVIKNCNKLIDMAYNGDSELKLEIDKFQQSILSVSDNGCEFDMKQAYDYLVDNPSYPLPTGFKKFDSYYTGFWRSDLIIIGGRTSVGKTAYAMSIALSMAQLGTPVVFVSLEMSLKQIMDRFESMVTGIPHEDIRRGKLMPNQIQNLDVGKEYIIGLPITIIDKAGLTPYDIRSRLRRLNKEGKCEVAFIDYLQIINNEGMGENENIKLGNVSGQLKGIAKELDIPVVALSQLKRGQDDRKDGMPRTSDLRGSGKIENDADMILLPHRQILPDSDGNLDGSVKLIIGKNRNGRTGMMTNYEFDAEIVKYREVEYFN